MRFPSFPVLAIVAACLPFASCGLVKLPVRVVGAVAEGTARAGKKAYDASAEALTKSDAEKAEDTRKMALEEAAEKEREARKKQAASPDGPTAPEASGETSRDAPEYLPLPGTSEPLPDDTALPYQGQP